MSSPAACPICRTPFAPDRRPWLWRCPGCGYYASTLTPALADATAHARLDEGPRADGLRALRGANFERVLDRLERVTPLAGRRVLDVGCAHGWFLDAAARRGAEAEGLEPDAAIAAAARARGLAVREGGFPEALPAGRRYDAIVFNDVFEHLPDPGTAVAACRAALAPGGVVALNLPLATGFFHRLARGLDRLGWGGPLDRLWQKGLPSPHLGYFTQDQLARLFGAAGLAERHRSTLRTLERRGLWARLTYVGGTPRPVSAVLWCLLTLACPLIGRLPADIGLQIFGGDETVPAAPPTPALSPP